MIRREFLTGFHKRKLQKKEAAKKDPLIPKPRFGGLREAVQAAARDSAAKYGSGRSPAKDGQPRVDDIRTGDPAKGSSPAKVATTSTSTSEKGWVSKPAIPFDPSVFHSYLLSLLPPIIGASPEELESIFDDGFNERVSRFASEGGGVVYVVKKKDEQECTSLP